jgi:hypothetical protein
MKLFEVWYFPVSQLVHCRFTFADGSAVMYVPAAHIDQLVHVVPSYVFDVWYCDSGQLEQSLLIDFSLLGSVLAYFPAPHFVCGVQDAAEYPFTSWY